MLLVITIDQEEAHPVAILGNIGIAMKVAVLDRVNGYVDFALFIGHGIRCGG